MKGVTVVNMEGCRGGGWRNGALTVAICVHFFMINHPPIGAETALGQPGTSRIVLSSLREREEKPRISAVIKYGSLITVRY